MALKSILTRNFKDLSSKMGDSIKYVDLDYEVKRSKDDPWTTHTRSTVCHNDYAILNAYRLWLQSKHYDYIRAPGFGGFFDNNLNDRFTFNVANEKAVSQALVAESAEKWPQITILECNVTCDMANRGWIVHIIAQDNVTKMVLNDQPVFVVNE
jgi:hypothetical protein